MLITDAAGNTKTVSGTLVSGTTLTLDTHGPSLFATSETLGPGNSGKLNISGTGDVGSTIKLAEGATQLGSTTVASDGSWTFNIGKVSDVDHSYTVSETDSGGTLRLALRSMAGLPVRHCRVPAATMPFTATVATTS